MSLRWRVRRPLVVAVLVVAMVGLGSVLAIAAPGSSGRTLNGKLADGATWEIQVPAHWNGTLFLYSHGYVVPGTANPAMDVGDPVTGKWMLSHGYALAGSSYATTGWAIQQAFPDQIKTLDIFTKRVGHPKRTVAWGHSLGGIITAGLVQDYPKQFNAALPMCGVLSGGVATWNTALDAQFAFKSLIDPSIAITNIKDPTGNLTAAEKAASAAFATPQGRARLALVAALGDTPGWYTTLSKQPAPTNYVAQEKQQYLWGANVDFPFAFALRAELEGRAGGNPSWNTGVNYVQDLAHSADAAEVRALYRSAGLNLNSDLNQLNHATRVSADPAAVRYLERYIVFNGHLSIPVLTMHTTGDGLVVPENESAYAQVVKRAGDSSLLRQVFVARAGHCAFTPAETITAVKDLVHRLNTGKWGSSATSPKALNATARALGSTDNIYVSGSKTVPTPPAFVHYQPPAYLRPFDAGDKIP
jgi:pimeloyl-ACP methyl ester carboxylesterase